MLNPGDNIKNVNVRSSLSMAERDLIHSLVEQVRRLESRVRSLEEKLVSPSLPVGKKRKQGIQNY